MLSPACAGPDGWHWLLAPVRPEVFEEGYWGKRALRLSRGGRHRAYYASLFSERDLDATLAAVCRVPGSLEIIPDRRTTSAVP